METLRFELPGAPTTIPRAAVEARTDKGEWLQGPIEVMSGSDRRYTIGAFSLLDDLNSAYVDVRMTTIEDPVASGTFDPLFPVSQLA